jgi:hypothetical protein
LHPPVAEGPQVQHRIGVDDHARAAGRRAQAIGLAS